MAGCGQTAGCLVLHRLGASPPMPLGGKCLECLNWIVWLCVCVGGGGTLNAVRVEALGERVLVEVD